MLMRAGTSKSEQFDLIVLSVGTRPSEHLSRLADVLNIELNDYGFVKTSQKSPLVTSGRNLRKRCMRGPEGYPETVTQASGAACEAASVISDARGKDLVIKELPEEKM